MTAYAVRRTGRPASGREAGPARGEPEPPPRAGLEAEAEGNGFQVRQQFLGAAVSLIAVLGQQLGHRWIERRWAWPG